MKKSLVIDFVILEKLNLSVKQLFILYLIVKKDKEVINLINRENLDYLTNLEDLENKKYIKLDKDLIPEARQSAIDLIDYLLIESFKELFSSKIIKKSKKRIKAEVVERIDEYRTKWKGLKAGSMGDKNSCIEKLSKWMEENPSYSFEDILNAVDLYLETEGANTRFLQRADFFIYKQDANKIESSRLSAFIDDASDGVEKDWTSNIN